MSNVIEKTMVKDYDNVVECMNTDRVNDVACEKVKSFYISSDSDKLCDKLCVVKGSNDGKHEGFLDMEMPCSPGGEEDCRKKRCADRYDSSESSDRSVFYICNVYFFPLHTTPFETHKEGTSFFFDYSDYAAA